MFQVIDNLITNAIKYAKSSTEISIKASLGDDKIKVEISNLKDPELYNSKETRHVNSTGFGLEIVREILKLHQSKLNIQETDNEFLVNFALDKAI